MYSRFHRARGAMRREQHTQPAALLAALLLIACVQPIVGQEAEDENDTSKEDIYTTSINVTASLPELDADVLEGSELLTKNRVDLAESLRDEPGMSAVRRGGVNLEPTIRGLQETQVALFVDGTRTFSAGPGRMDSGLSHLSPHAARQVSIVKGPYALTWGASALSAIDVRTYIPGFSESGHTTGGRASIHYGENNDSTDALAQLFGSSESIRYSLLANHRAADDYESGDGSVVPGDYESFDLLGRFALRLGSNGELDLSGGYQAQDDIDYPGRLLDATYFKTRSYRLAYNWSGQRGALDGFEAKLYSNRKDHLMNNDEKPTARAMPGRIPPFGLDVGLPAESNTSGGRVMSSFSRNDFQFRFGVDAYQLDQKADRFIRRRSNGVLLFQDIVWPDAKITDQGLYGQLLHSGDSWQLGATVRGDTWESEAGQVSDFFAANTAGDLSQDDSHLSAALSGRFVVAEDWSISAGVGRAVRTPTAIELYSDRFPSTRFQIAAEFMGNPALEPEESLEFNTGIAGRGGPPERPLSVQLDLFYRTISDSITVSPDSTLPRRLPLSPPVVYRYINGNDTVYRGGELRLEQRLGSHWSWRVNAAYTWAEDELFQEPALGIAPFTLTGGVRVAGLSGRLWGDLSVTRFDDQDRVAVSRFEQATEGATVLDLRGAFAISDSLELTASLLNAFDEGYAHHLNSPNPFSRSRILEMGRSWNLGVRLTL